MCDRMRDNTHCHSFAHDFHLRVVHKFVKHKKDFHSKYHLVKMLKDFDTFYQESPLYSRNAVALSELKWSPIAAGHLSILLEYDKLICCSHLLSKEIWFGSQSASKGQLVGDSVTVALFYVKLVRTRRFLLSCRS